jgi:hypothetical protein
MTRAPFLPPSRPFLPPDARTRERGEMTSEYSFLNVDRRSVPPPVPPLRSPREERDESRWDADFYRRSSRSSPYREKIT